MKKQISNKILGLWYLAAAAFGVVSVALVVVFFGAGQAETFRWIIVDSLTLVVVPGCVALLAYLGSRASALMLGTFALVILAVANIVLMLLDLGLLDGLQNMSGALVSQVTYYLPVIGRIQVLRHVGEVTNMQLQTILVHGIALMSELLITAGFVLCLLQMGADAAARLAAARAGEPAAQVGQ